MADKHYLCFIEEFQEDTELYHYIVSLDEQGADIQLYTASCTQNIQPENVLSCMESLGRKQGEEYLFLTDIPNLYFLCYRLYHQVFDGFLFLEGKETRDIQLEEIYHAIRALPIQENEISTTNAVEICSTYFFLHGQYFIFEPVKGKGYRVIAPDNEKPNMEMNYSNTVYMFRTNKDILDQLMNSINDFQRNPKQELVNMDTLLHNLGDIYGSEMPYGKLMMERAIWDMVKIPAQNITTLIWLLSWLVYVGNDSDALEELLQCSISNTHLNVYNRYYLWNQVKRIQLVCTHASTEETGRLQNLLYQKVYKEYYAHFKQHLRRVPKEEREKDTILVLSYSFLGERHAPTRTTLERVYTLGKQLGKKVMLINTRETLTKLGMLPLYYNNGRNLIEEYSRIDNYEYKGYTFPFLQPDHEMPEYDAIGDLIDLIRRKKPYFILNIGGGSILSDLCSNMIPVLSMALAFSTLPLTMSRLSILGRKLKVEEWESLYQNGYDRDGIIESRFTFDLIEKHSELSRDSLNLPADKFLLLVVGIRLDSEITEEFILTMEKTFALGTHLVFAGKFETYDRYCVRFPNLKEHSTFIGYCNDMLALNAVCNLYVNPHRLGGGFSIIEAFHEGVPGISTYYGDVASAAGDEFCVNDYEEMVTTITRYMEDNTFYNYMSDKARKRAVLMMDSKSAMEEIIEKAESSKYFF